MFWPENKNSQVLKTNTQNHE